MLSHALHAVFPHPHAFEQPHYRICGIQGRHLRKVLNLYLAADLHMSAADTVDFTVGAEGKLPPGMPVTSLGDLG